MSAPVRVAKQSLLIKWVGWLDLLSSQLNAVYVDQELFAELHQAFVDAGTPSQFWLNHYQRLYVPAQAMAVRRIVRGDSDDIAVTSLLKDIKHHRRELTQEWYSAVASRHAGNNDKELLRKVINYRDIWCDNGPCIAGAKLDADRNSVMQQVRAVCDLADRTVAELKGAIDIVAAVLHRYRILFTGVDQQFPPIIATDWRGPFRQALFPLGESTKSEVPL